jgi:hypothetical protein
MAAGGWIGKRRSRRVLRSDGGDGRGRKDVELGVDQPSQFASPLWGHLADTGAKVGKS